VRVAVLPRDIAAGVITGSISRIAWAVGAANLVLVVPPLVEVLVSAGRADALAGPLALIAAQLVLLGLAALFSRPVTTIVYLAVGSALVILYQLQVMVALPGPVSDYTFLLNRPSIALAMVGVITASTLVGVSWFVAGLVVAVAGGAVSAALYGVAFRPGVGPFMVVALGIIAYLTFASIQRSQRRRVPNFDELEAETRRLERGEDLARRTTAAVHDTLLNDLSVVMNGPDRLDDRARERLRRDLDVLTSAEWLTTATALVPADPEDAELRNEITRLVGEFQWRGLTVQVSGSGDGIYRLHDGVSSALVDAIRASLENVLRHSGVGIADLTLAYSDELITVMVTDQGLGFDPAAIPRDRLGVRESIIERVRAVGGRVDVWSSPGAGTSIVMSAPVAEIVLRHTPSRHREENPDA